MGEGRKMDLKETVCEVVDWIDLAQESDGRQAVVNMVKNRRVSYNARNFLLYVMTC